MESLQDQIITLNSKVDVLGQVIENLSNQLSNFCEGPQTTHEVQNPYSTSLGTEAPRLTHQSWLSGESTRELGHKDILLDDDVSDQETSGSDRHLAPEMQIQRLTAQLTAAYNRIAALEEQLLSQRIR